MTIKQVKAFHTISQRVIYGLNFMYSDFAPVRSECADVNSQQKLHALMGKMIDKLYAAPEILELADNPDEAYTWYALNNSNPELDAVYKSVCKSLYEFYRFLYISFLHGEVDEDGLRVENKVLSQNKTRYKPVYGTFLGEFGIGVVKGKAETVFTLERDILQAFRLLAECIPVNVNAWTPYALTNFACCSFSGDFDFLLERVDHVTGSNGLLSEMEDRCMGSDYKKTVTCSFGTSDLNFQIKYQNKVGGFVIGYNPRKYWQFYFGSLNSIGVKAMLEDFEHLDSDVQKYLITVCKTCNGCLGCTKGGKNKIFAVRVEYDGKEYLLCNDNYARHDWETIDRDLMSLLFKYHAAQEIYGPGKRQKRDMRKGEGR